MKEAIFPFLVYCVLQPFVGIVGLNMVKEEELGSNEILRSWISGQMILFATIQVLAVPMILCRLKFSSLFWGFIVVTIVFFCFGCRKRRKVRLKKMTWKRMTPMATALLITVLVFIGIQFYKYFFMMHLDQDDARWLAEANDALEYGDMLIRHYDTGEFIGYIYIAKDATSPWSMMIATISRILSTSPALFAHTIYAPVELLLMYTVYWLIGTELFRKLETRFVFLLSIVIINLFFGMTVYTQSTFSLVRIWQGKATVAGVIIPLILYVFLRIYRQDESYNWRMLPVVCCAACLMSGMGISISAILILVYGVFHIVAVKQWERIPLLILSVLPSAVFLFIYSLFRYLY